MRKSGIQNEQISIFLDTEYFDFDSRMQKDSNKPIDLQKVFLFVMLYAKIDKFNKIDLVVELAILLSLKSMSNRRSVISSNSDQDHYDINWDIVIFVISLVLSWTWFPFNYNYSQYYSERNFDKFSKFCKYEPNLFIRQAKIKLNVLLASDATMVVDTDNESGSSKNKVVRSSDLKKYLQKVASVIFVPK